VNDIIIALIGTIGTVMVGGFSLIGVMLSRTQGNVKATRKLAAEAKEQVTNNHAANFRDEVTGIGDTAAEIKSALSAHGEVLGAIGEQLAKQGSSLKHLHGKVNAQGQSIAELTSSDKAQWKRLDKRDLQEENNNKE
jgi:hypothetical protein